MISLNATGAASPVSYHLNQNNRNLQKSLTRLSSGYRINSAVDDPGGATEAAIGFGCVDGAVAGFGGADPTLFGLGCSDVGRVARSAQGRDEFVQEGAGDAVIVGDE